MRILVWLAVAVAFRAPTPPRTTTILHSKEIMAAFEEVKAAAALFDTEPEKSTAMVKIR